MNTELVSLVFLSISLLYPLPAPAADPESLIGAAGRGDAERVQQILSNSADPDATANSSGSGGLTALIVASQSGHSEVIEVLLKAGADVNAADYDGGTALLAASKSGHPEAVKVLLMSGANANATATYGFTALMFASQNGHTDVVEILLKAQGDADATANDGRTALLAASQSGHREVVEILLDAGADANVISKNGATALTLAEDNGHGEIVRILLRWDKESRPTPQEVQTGTLDRGPRLVAVTKRGRETVVGFKGRNPVVLRNGKVAWIKRSSVDFEFEPTTYHKTGYVKVQGADGVWNRAFEGAPPGRHYRSEFRIGLTANENIVQCFAVIAFFDNSDVVGNPFELDDLIGKQIGFLRKGEEKYFRLTLPPLQINFLNYQVMVFSGGAPVRSPSTGNMARRLEYADRARVKNLIHERILSGQNHDLVVFRSVPIQLRGSTADNWFGKTVTLTVRISPRGNVVGISCPQIDDKEVLHDVCRAVGAYLFLPPVNSDGLVHETVEILSVSLPLASEGPS